MLTMPKKLFFIFLTASLMSILFTSTKAHATVTPNPYPSLGGVLTIPSIYMDNPSDPLNTIPQCDNDIWKFVKSYNYFGTWVSENESIPTNRSITVDYGTKSLDLLYNQLMTNCQNSSVTDGYYINTSVNRIKSVGSTPAGIFTGIGSGSNLAVSVGTNGSNKGAFKQERYPFVYTAASPLGFTTSGEYKITFGFKTIVSRSNGTFACINEFGNTDDVASLTDDSRCITWYETQKILVTVKTENSFAAMTCSGFSGLTGAAGTWKEVTFNIKNNSSNNWVAGGSSTSPNFDIGVVDIDQHKSIATANGAATRSPPGGGIGPPDHLSAGSRSNVTAAFTNLDVQLNQDGKNAVYHRVLYNRDDNSGPTYHAVGRYGTQTSINSGSSRQYSVWVKIPSGGSKNYGIRLLDRQGVTATQYKWLNWSSTCSFKVSSATAGTTWDYEHSGFTINPSTFAEPGDNVNVRGRIHNSQSGTGGDYTYALQWSNGPFGWGAPNSTYGFVGEPKLAGNADSGYRNKNFSIPLDAKSGQVICFKALITPYQGQSTPTFTYDTSSWRESSPQCITVINGVPPPPPYVPPVCKSSTLPTIEVGEGFKPTFTMQSNDNIVTTITAAKYVITGPGSYSTTGIVTSGFGAALSGIGLSADRTYPDPRITTASTTTVGEYKLSWTTITYKSATGVTGNTSCAADVTGSAAASPYVRYYGNDVIAGGGFGESCSQPTSTVIGPSTYSPSTPKDRSTYKGSAAQLAILASGQIDGVIPGSLLAASFSAVEFSFANNNNPAGSVSSSTRKFGGYFGAIPCADKFPDTSKDGPWEPSLPASLNGANKGRYFITGDITIVNGKNISNGQRIKLVVDGDVYITSDITYQNTNWGTDIADIPLVQIYANNIRIAGSVSQLDGLYAAKGEINTCQEFTGITASTAVYATCNNKLVVNGAFIAKQVKLRRTIETVNSSVPGENAATTKAAEVFRFSPELYLALLSESGGKSSYDSISSPPPAL